MYDLGFCVKVIECEEHLRQTSSKQLFREAMRGVSVQEIFKTIPHRFLDKASMVPALSGNGEHVEGCPDMAISWMGSIAFAQDVVHIVFVLIHPLSCENFQGCISMATVVSSIKRAQMPITDLL